MITVSLSLTTVVWRSIPFHKATCAITLRFKSGYPEVEGVAQPLDDKLVAAFSPNQSLNAKTK